MPESETPWEFIPDDDVDDVEPSAEESAMHIDDGSVRPAHDPGLTDVEMGDATTSASTGFETYDDEQPEFGDRAAGEETEELDVVLEHQGYLANNDEGAEPEHTEAPADVTTSDSTDWEGLLIAERARLTDLRDNMLAELPTDVSQRELSGESSSSAQHPADTATTTYEREVEHALLRQLDGELIDVERALAKLQDGTYGTCERCKGPIGRDRLHAAPAARFCITDQRTVASPGTPV